MGNVSFKLPPTAAERLEAVKATQIREINDAYTAAAAPLVRNYPEIETKGWPQQDAEARAYLAWHDAGGQGEPPAMPVLQYILEGRNGEGGTETMLELCQAVEFNAQMFRQAQVLTGQRQRLVKAVGAASTVEEVESITWPDAGEEA